MWHNTFPAERDPALPWLVTFYEPLATKAPKEAKPYCCYLRRVVFYTPDYPNSLQILDEVEGQWDLAGTRWTSDPQLVFGALEPFVAHEGEYFDLMGGRVIWWQDKGWHVEWRARRIYPEHNQLLKHWLEVEKPKEEIGIVN